jgi:Txe/YoeB family toxin of Txe-Axe toxin-antitoxin module
MAGRKIKSNAPWFSHDNNMRNNKRVKALRTKFPLSGYPFWCMFLEVLCESENIQFERTELSVMLLSGDFGLENDLNELMDYCIKIELLQVDGGDVFAQELIDRLSPMFDKRKKMRDKYEKSISDKGKENLPISDTEIRISEEEKQNLPQTDDGNTHNKVEYNNSIDIEKKEEDNIFNPESEKPDKKNKRFYDENSNEFRLANFLSKEISKSNPNNKAVSNTIKNNFQKWSDEIRIISEQDKRTFKEIGEIIKCAHNDNHWKGIICTPSKLRQHYDALYVIMPKRNSKSQPLVARPANYYDEEEDTTDYSVLPGYDPRFPDRTFPKGYPEESKLKLLKIIAEEAEEERLELENRNAQQ